MGWPTFLPTCCWFLAIIEHLHAHTNSICLKAVDISFQVSGFLTHKTIAKEVLKSMKTKQYIVKALGKELALEIKAMASDYTNSILQSQEAENLIKFKWNMLQDELSANAPQLKSLLFSATKTTRPRSNVQAVVGMCVAILLNNRNPKMKNRNSIL